MVVEIKVKEIQSEETYQIRHAVLRPNQALSDCKYPGDNDENTFHLGAYQGSQLVGIASFYHENNIEFNEQNQYRLRGMATLPPYRGLNAGKQLIRTAEKILKGRDAELWWCNARTTASAFYEKIGLVVHGDIFEIDPIGLHKLMVRKL